MFGIARSTVAAKLVSLQPYGHNYLLTKTHAFSQTLTAKPLVKLENLDPAVNCKSYTLAPSFHTLVFVLFHSPFFVNNWYFSISWK